jgi:hypothetical protein
VKYYKIKDNKNDKLINEVFIHNCEDCDFHEKLDCSSHVRDFKCLMDNNKHYRSELCKDGFPESCMFTDVNSYRISDSGHSVAIRSNRNNQFIIIWSYEDDSPYSKEKAGELALEECERLNKRVGY